LISLVVPTYNERQNIEKLVERTGQTLALAGEPYELIIVDDNSPDGTAGEVRRLQDGRPWLKLVVREDERDLSTAVLAGWRVAQGDILGVMDGDLQHPPEHLLKLLEPPRNGSGEIAIASRYVEHGSVSEWKFRRRIISWTATLIAYVVLPSRIRRVKDPMSGFFLLRRSVVEGRALKPLGYKILLEVLARGNYKRTVEVPYTFEERARGGSKMGLAQVWRFFIHLLRIRFTP
jgi:dolichol-phosphate mannosyltransferase